VGSGVGGSSSGWCHAEGDGAGVDDRGQRLADSGSAIVRASSGVVGEEKCGADRWSPCYSVGRCKVKEYSNRFNSKYFKLIQTRFDLNRTFMSSKNLK
jgi:hypothetical protein